jgi:hypothetical protein
MLQSPNFRNNVVKIIDTIYKVEGNMNLQRDPNYFTFEKKINEMCSVIVIKQEQKSENQINYLGIIQ